MGVFRRDRDGRARADARDAESARANDIPSSRPALRDARAAEPAFEPIPATFRTIQIEPSIDAEPGGGVEESDVFVCRRSVEPDVEVVAPEQAALAGVTLFVYGWENVQPGSLSWAFPSLRAALLAVRTMKNAVAWCICSGNAWTSVDAARAEGAVLVEQSS